MAFDASNDPIQAVLDGVKTLLLSALPDLDVADFPDNPEEWELYHDLGALLVRFHGTEYAENEDMAGTVQRCRHTIIVSVCTRSLTGPYGAYLGTTLVRQALNGKRFGNTERSQAVRADFVHRKGGVWRFDVAFEVGAFAITEEADEVLPLLKSTDISEETQG